MTDQPPLIHLRQPDVRCPRCGEATTSRLEAGRSKKRTVMDVIGAFTLIIYRYICTACGLSFTLLHPAFANTLGQMYNIRPLFANSHFLVTQRLWNEVRT